MTVSSEISTAYKTLGFAAVCDCCEGTGQQARCGGCGRYFQDDDDRDLFQSCGCYQAGAEMGDCRNCDGSGFVFWLESGEQVTIEIESNQDGWLYTLYPIEQGVLGVHVETEDRDLYFLVTRENAREALPQDVRDEVALYL